ncbi:MAG: FtsW/RodA/SpoVE family cell cycle protein, partial [Clostridia bacterium]|nr:FtsW/RodA/SpoVE family cell cycle protein [Clostridia bacterium]
MKSGSVEKMRRALPRSNTRLLLSAVMIFQVIALLLIAFQSETINMQPLIMAAALPVLTAMITMLMGKLWPVDRAILIMVLFLCSVGLITLQDIAKSNETPLTQAIYAGAGVLAMFIGAVFIRKWKKWKKFTLPLMALCLIALMTPWLPAPIGKWYQGARNWVHLGPISGQPSEFMKPVMIVILASCFANRPRFFKCVPGIAFAAICCGILLIERDLGALLLYFLTTVLMYYTATSNAAVALTGLGMGAGAAVAAYHALPYVQDRVAIWRNPWSDPLDTGWQIVQSLMAIGSGGLFGMGLGLGSPRNVP